MRANKQEIWQRKLANWPTLWGIKHNKNETRLVNSHCVSSSRPSESLAAEVRTTDRQGFLEDERYVEKLRLVVERIRTE